MHGSDSSLRYICALSDSSLRYICALYDMIFQCGFLTSFYNMCVTYMIFIRVLMWFCYYIEMFLI